MKRVAEPTTHGHIWTSTFPERLASSRLLFMRADAKSSTRAAVFRARGAAMFQPGRATRVKVAADLGHPPVAELASHEFGCRALRLCGLQVEGSVDAGPKLVGVAWESKAAAAEGCGPFSVSTPVDWANRHGTRLNLDTPNFAHAAAWFEQTAMQQRGKGQGKKRHIDGGDGVGDGDDTAAEKAPKDDGDGESHWCWLSRVPSCSRAAPPLSLPTAGSSPYLVTGPGRRAQEGRENVVKARGNSRRGSEEVAAAAGGGPKDQHGETFPAVLRRGRWTEEEEAYAWCLIRHFERGVLRIPSGTSLRNFLAEKLHCDPMRISKKFAGDSSVGKRVYHRCPRGVAEPGGDLARAEAELEAHEQVFFGKAKRSKTTRNKSSRQAQNFTASVFEAPCSSSSYSETSSASTKRGGAMLALELATSWPCTKRADTCHSGLGGKRQRTTSDCVRSEPFARAYGCGSDEGAQKESHGGIERGVPPFVPAWRHQQHEQPQQKRDWAWRSGDGDYSSYREAETQRLGFDRCHDDVVAGLFLNFVRGAAEAALSMKARSVLGDTTETPADHGPSDGHISPTSSFDYSSSSSDSGISTTGSDCF